MNNGFHSRRVTTPLRDYLKCLVPCLVIVVFVSLFARFLEPEQIAVAKEPLTFGRLVARVIRLPERKVYTWKGAPEYKVERMAYYQQLLEDRGITDRKHLKLLVANLIVENGALDEMTDGDSGCSVGIPMKNVCQFGYSAKSFRKKYPEWNDWRFQLEWMADHTLKSYQKFDSDVRLAIISHNSPAAAARGVDACHISPCYYQRVVNASKLLTSL